MAALVSQNRADVELGVQHGTVARLVGEGRVRAVPWLGRIRVPRSEVERLAREGLTTTGRRPRARQVRVPGLCDPDALRRLDVSTL
jgi:hypothetical protein